MGWASCLEDIIEKNDVNRFESKRLSRKGNSQNRIHISIRNDDDEVLFSKSHPIGISTEKWIESLEYLVENDITSIVIETIVLQDFIKKIRRDITVEGYTIKNSSNRYSVIDTLKYLASVVDEARSKGIKAKMELRDQTARLGQVLNKSVGSGSSPFYCHSKITGSLYNFPQSSSKHLAEAKRHLKNEGLRCHEFIEWTKATGREEHTRVIDSEIRRRKFAYFGYALIARLKN